MKRLVSTVAIFVLIASAGQVAYLYATRGVDHSVSVSMTEEANANTYDHSLPVLARDLVVGVPQAVDFSADAISMQDFTTFERNDQYRDWLLFAVVSARDLKAENFSHIFFDLPPMRRGYMRALGTFEYGDTRSRVLDKTTVIALVLAGRSEAQRRDDLAHIADQQRKNLGEPFERMEVVEYSLDGDHATARLTRLQDVSYADLFSAQYGYVEMPLASIADFNGFIAAVDDLTFVTKIPNGVLAGGRKFLSGHHSPIGVEEVAAVWQSERNNRVREEKFNAQADERLQALNARYDAMVAKGVSTSSLQADYDADTERLKKQLRDEYHAQHIVGGSGFSLDPVVQFPKLRKLFDGIFAAMPAEQSRSVFGDGGIQAVDKGLDNNDIGPYVRMAGQLLQDRNTFLFGLLMQKAKADCSYQAARYDGDLQGTSAGMTLFYTDLIAKLWTIDFVKSSPRRKAIMGFVDDPHVKLSHVYDKESEELSAARLWFGPANQGYQVANDNGTLLFARTATRIYSAGHNEATPGEEVQTSAFLAAAIEWWNDHYEEVADYEPQYQRLNEIMKWSVVIAWLNQTLDMHQLDYLSSVTVDRSNVFPKWAARNKALRFDQWHEVGFLKAGYAGTTTEALPQLSGPVTEGGVSLAMRDAAMRPSLADGVEQVLRRSTIKYSSDLNAIRTSEGQLSIKTFDETLFTLKPIREFESIDDMLVRLRPINEDRFLIVAKAKEATKLRSISTQVSDSEFTSTVITQPGTVRIESRIADVPLDDFSVERTANGFRIGLQARRMDRVSALARDLSGATDPVAVMQANPMISTVLRVQGKDSVFARFERGGEWGEFAPEKTPRVNIDSDWQLRAAGFDDDVTTVIQARMLHDTQMREILGNGHVTIEVTADGKHVIVLIPDQAAPVEVITVHTRQGDVSAWVDRDSGIVHMIPKDAGNNSLAIGDNLQRADLDAIREAARGSGVKELMLHGEGAARPELVANLEQGNMRKAALHLVDDPVSARHAIDNAVAKAVRRTDDIHEQLGADEALHYLDRLRVTYGDRPEIALRRSLVELERGRVDAAVEALSRAPGMGPVDRQAFYDEVNARIQATADPHSDISRFAQFVHCQEHAGSHGDSWIDMLTPRVQGGRFDFEATLRGMPSDGHVLGVSDLRRDDWVIYRQSTASLDHLDWNQPIDKAIPDIVSGKLGKFVELPDGDIAQYRPSVIWSADHQTEFTPVIKAKQYIPLPNQLPGSSSRSCNQVVNDPSCDGADASAEPRRPRVLLVMAN